IATSVKLPVEWSSRERKESRLDPTRVQALRTDAMVAALLQPGGERLASRADFPAKCIDGFLQGFGGEQGSRELPTLENLIGSQFGLRLFECPFGVDDV